MKRTLTTCPFCGCGCGLYLMSDGKRLVGAYPSENHPVSKGSLCVKGWNCYEFVNRKERLKKPLIKKGEKFQEVSWDEAIGLIVSKFKKFQADHGNDSVAFLSSAKTTNEENYLMMKLARACFKTNNVDHCARLCHASTVVGLAATFGSGAMTNSIGEFENADVVLITGSDTTEQHPLIGSRILNAVEKKNAKLIVVDPREVQMAKYAIKHLRQKNGTDVAWINGMMNVIISEGLEDKKYIENCTENYEELKKTVAEYTPEVVEKITGIKKDDLIEAARIYANAKKASIVYSMGITQHTTGVDNVKSCANLAMLTGNVGFESTGVNPLRGQNNVQGACDMGALPNAYSGYQPVTSEENRSKFEKAWGVSGLPGNVGLTVTEVVDMAGKGEVKGVYIMGENPMLSDPDIHHVEECLNKTEFLVVQDIFLTETARLADVVLPGVTFAEKDGTFTNTERRCERVRKAIEPLEDAKPDWEILCMVAKKAGYDGMDYKSPADIMDEIANVTPIYGGMQYDRIDEWGLQWPCPNRDHGGTKFLHVNGKFSKGKGFFTPVTFKPPAETPDGEYPFTLSTGRTYFHFHTGTMTRKISTLHREVPEGYVEIHPDDAKNLKVRTGDKMKVTSRRGSIDIKALVTDKGVPGSVFIPFHFAESPANILTIGAVDPVAKIPEYKVCAVRIERCQ